MDKPEWMQDSLVKNIDDKKLQFLQELVLGGKGKNQKEIMPYMLLKMKQAKAEHISFSQTDITNVIAAIKAHSSEEENTQMDQLLKKAPTK